ncbi:MAG TPA: hypothetical protein VMM15_23295 [Bradyrhizobium sp.]|nr:hypothetical protein [Bradyrhizobium sp.]
MGTSIRRFNTRCFWSKQASLKKGQTEQAMRLMTWRKAPIVVTWDDISIPIDDNAARAATDHEPVERRQRQSRTSLKGPGGK